MFSPPSSPVNTPAVAASPPLQGMHFVPLQPGPGDRFAPAGSNLAKSGLPAAAAANGHHLGRALEWGLCVWGWRGKSRVESEGGGVWCGQLALGAWVPHSGVLWLFLSFLVFSWSFLLLMYKFLRTTD